ncbi:unnamed protein product, partial [Sphacelaria rigidula]
PVGRRRSPGSGRRLRCRRRWFSRPRLRLTCWFVDLRLVSCLGFFLWGSGVTSGFFPRTGLVKQKFIRTGVLDGETVEALIVVVSVRAGAPTVGAQPRAGGWVRGRCFAFKVRFIFRFPRGVVRGEKVTEETVWPDVLPASTLRARPTASCRATEGFCVVDVWGTVGWRPFDHIQTANAVQASSVPGARLTADS